MILCVTGPMAAGKNLAAAILEKKGFVSIDADTLAHEAVDSCRDTIIKEFSALAKEKGIQLEKSDGKIDRRALAAIVFSDPTLLNDRKTSFIPISQKK